MKYSEVTALSAAEMKSKMKETQAELFEARMKHSLGQLANQMDLRRLRRDLARMKTAIVSGQTKGAAKTKTAAPKATKRGRK